MYRWDETPDVAGMGGMATPGMGGMTPGYGVTPAFGVTPMPGQTPWGMGMETPTPSQLPAMNKMTPEQFSAFKADREMQQRNRYLSDEELDATLPGEDEGYKIVSPPSSYKPIRTPARKLMGTPTPGMTPGYVMPSENPVGVEAYGVTRQLEGLPDIREEDMEHFGRLLAVRVRVCMRVTA